MEKNDSYSNSEIIDSKNNYKFDNYGIVMANSIEDLLYDKYNHITKHHINDTNAIQYDNFSELFENDNIKLNKNSKENRFKEKLLLYNKNNQNDKYHKSNSHQNLNAIQKEFNNNYNGLKNGKNTTNKNLESHNEGNKNVNYNNINQIKIIKGKDLQIKNKEFNKRKNKEIKIIFNIKDKNNVGYDSNNNSKLNSNNIKKMNLVPSSEYNKSNCIDNKIIQKEQGLFISKIYGKKKDSNKKKIIFLPKSISCHFIKHNKIITFKKVNSPIKNVRNDLYFCTKEIFFNKEQKHKKVFIRRIGSKNKTKQNEKHTKNQSNKSKKKAEATYTEIDITKYNNSPNILIKIIKNPKNLKNKKDIKTNSSNNIVKSKSCQKIIYINLDDKKKTPISQIKQKMKKIKKIHNNRYKNIKENSELPLLKNKEIINALNNSSKYKGKNCLDFFSLNRRKKFSEKIYRNLRLPNKNISKSDKNIKNQLFYINRNIRAQKTGLKNEEKTEGKKKIRKYSSNIEKIFKINIFPKTNKEINRENNVINRQNNIIYSPLNKYSNFTSIEFPAIDSYFN